MNLKNHKDWVREVFDKAAPLYGKKGCSYFDAFAKSLISKTNLMSGERVLDVATGTGAILFPAAEAVGEAGSVVGIDISPEMIAECAKQKISSKIQLHIMDGENLNFPDNSVDVVFCGFAIFFFPDVKRALAEFKRVLKHNGRLAISVWGNPSPLTRWVVENSKKYGVVKPLKTSAIDTRDILNNILSDAGFGNIEIYEETAIFRHESVNEWWDSLSSHAIRSSLEQLSNESLEILHEDALKFAESQCEDGRIREPMHAIFATGKNLQIKHESGFSCSNKSTSQA